MLATEILKEFDAEGMKPEDYEKGMMARLKADRQKVKNQLSPTKIIKLS